MAGDVEQHLAQQIWNDNGLPDEHRAQLTNYRKYYLRKINLHHFKPHFMTHLAAQLLQPSTCNLSDHWLLGYRHIKHMDSSKYLSQLFGNAEIWRILWLDNYKTANIKFIHWSEISGNKIKFFAQYIAIHCKVMAVTECTARIDLTEKQQIAGVQAIWSN